MGEPAGKPHIRYADYLALEKSSQTKHEWLNGQVFDMEALGMSGGRPEHALRIAAVIAALRVALRGKRGSTYASELKVRIHGTGLATYPDASVICGKLETDPEDDLAVVNPTVLVEVLSPTSEAYDRGAKFAHYRRIPSLRDYVMVNCSEPRIEVYRRGESGRWELDEAGAGESIEITSLGVALSVDEIYADPLAEAAAG